MRRSVLDLTTVMLIGLATLAAAVGVLGHPTTEPRRPLVLANAEADSIYGAATYTEPTRRPWWDIHDLTPLPDSPQHESALNFARACLLEAGEPVAEERTVRWWRARVIVFFWPRSPAMEFLGLTVPDEGDVVHVILSDAIVGPTYEVMVHEAVHALCGDTCLHGRTQLADRCGERVRT